MFKHLNRQLQARCEVPVICLVIGGIALVISIAVHIANFAVILRLSRRDSFDIATRADFPDLHAEPAALTVVHASQYSLHADDEWTSSIPVGGGFLRKPNTHDYFAVSMFHQLHCLNNLRRFIAAGHNLSFVETGHADHCLKYLRQMILCHSDITTEPVKIIQDFDGVTWIRGATGIGITHQCRDWERVREYAERNYEGWKWKA